MVPGSRTTSGTNTLGKMWPFRTRRQTPTLPQKQDAPKVDEAALRALCPHIRALLDGELAAGNTVDTAASSDWPRPNSVIVTANRLFAYSYSDHCSVCDPMFYSMFDPKIGDGDSYPCTEHSHLLLAPMPTLRSLRWE